MKLEAESPLGLSISAFASGLLFALGLGLGGMTDANTVLGFLNLAGDWNPSLAFVMLGAIAVYAPAYRLYAKLHRNEQAPWQSSMCNVPTHTHIDRQLLVGAAIFGVGWGLGGFCPGPALVSVVTGAVPVMVFIAAMALGMYAFRRFAAKGL